jgi:hypothetical protein
MFGLPDPSNGGEAVLENYGVVGGPAPADTNTGSEHYPTMADAVPAQQKADAAFEHALKLAWVPWYVWAALGIATVLVLLNELNPTLELLHDVVKSK